MRQLIIIFILFFGCVELAAKDIWHLPVVGNASKLQVECFYFNHEGSSVVVYTADGLLVSSQTNVFLSQGRNSYFYDVSNYKSDVYIVTCIVDGIKTSTKVTGNGFNR